MDKQRQATLRSFFSKCGSALRPILTSTNGEQGWIFSFPIPRSERTSRGKVYHHIVVDPWIAGSTFGLAVWFIKLTLENPAHIDSAQGIEACAAEIEDLAKEYLSEAEVTELAAVEKTTQDDGYEGLLDAILVPWHYSDHLHQDSLIQFDKRIPIIVTDTGAAIVRGWNHFTNIVKLQDLPRDAKTWQAPSLRPEVFPSWLTSFMINRTEKFTYAVIWTHAREGSDALVHESIFVSPHGTRWNRELETFAKLSPPTTLLAYQQPLKNVYTFYGNVGIGDEGGLEVYRKLGGAKYWIPTHASSILYSGILPVLLRMRHVYAKTLEGALKKEKDTGLQKGEDPNLVHVENGGCFVLE